MALVFVAAGAVAGPARAQAGGEPEFVGVPSSAVGRLRGCESSA